MDRPRPFARHRIAVVAAVAALSVVAAAACEPVDPADPAGEAVWDRLAECEASGNWKANTGNGYYGGLQFSASSWQWVGGTGLPHQHSRAEQVSRGRILQSKQGWGAWPACSRKLGLR